MKRCPECRRDYYDDSLLYCLDDGTGLLEGPTSADTATTAILHNNSSFVGDSKEPGSRMMRDASPSIAVLPFSNISADPDNEYFCDGLAEELLNALAKVEGLRVAARTSAFSFKTKDVKVDEVGRVLNVKTVLEGSVRKSGSKLRITVQLINTRDGYQLWSQRYDRELSDIFEVQDDITSSVVDALRLELLEAGITVAARQTSLEAYDLYLKGRYHLAKVSPADLQKSVTYFEQTMRIDDRYALAYVGLAEGLWRISIAGERPSKEYLPRAKAAAQHALLIDDKLGAAHVALAWIALFYDWNWSASEEHCRRALQLNPNDAEAFTAHAHLLSNTGRHSDAIGKIALARNLDPLSLLTWAIEGQILFYAGYIDDALSTLSDLIELEPALWLGHLFAAEALREKGMFEQAVSEARAAAQYSGGSTIAAAFEAFALAGEGKRSEAEALLHDALCLAATKYVPPYHLALLHKAVGNLDEALSYLERAIDERDMKLVFLNVEPRWNDMREDDRFLNVLKQVGFPGGPSH